MTECVWCSIFLFRGETFRSHAKKLLFTVSFVTQPLFSASAAEIRETVSVFMCECQPWLDTPLTWDNHQREATIVRCIVVQLVKKEWTCLAQGQAELVTAGLKINLVLPKLWIILCLLKHFTWLGDMRFLYCTEEKKGYLMVQDGMMLSVCVRETVPLGLCHSALDFLTRVRVFLLDCTRDPGTPRINCCIVCLHMHNNYRALCVFLCPCLLFSSVALFVSTDTMLEITVGFILYNNSWQWCILYENQVFSLPPLEVLYPCSSLNNNEAIWQEKEC